MVNITNTKSCPYISPPVYKPPMYKPTKKCLRTNISPGLIFGGLRYSTEWDLRPYYFNYTKNHFGFNVGFQLRWDENFPERMFCMARFDSLKCTRSSTFECYTREVRLISSHMKLSWYLFHSSELSLLARLAQLILIGPKKALSYINESNWKMPRIWSSHLFNLISV